MHKPAPIILPEAVSSEDKTIRKATIEKVDNGYIVTLFTSGKNFMELKLVENRLRRAVGSIAKFMEVADIKEG